MKNLQIMFLLVSHRTRSVAQNLLIIHNVPTESCLMEEIFFFFFDQ